MTKAVHLARISSAPVQPHARVIVAILTGQIDLRASPLSAVQRDFLAALQIDAHVVSDGFPFDAQPSVDKQTGMIAASVANARQYLWAHFDPSYRAAIQAHLSALAQSCGRALVLITGSCGLAIAAAGLRDPAAAAKTWILALGPAGAPPVGLAGFRAVQGKNDPWSRALYRGPTPMRIGCGHLDYWADPHARAIAKDFIAAPCRL